MMPEVNQLDFLVSRELKVERNVIYVYQSVSRFLRQRTIQRIVSVIEARELVPISADPLQSAPDSGGLFGEGFCDFIDLGLLQEKEKRLKLRIEAAVEQFLRAIVEERRVASGFVLIVPSSDYDPVTGPVWIEKSWPSWPSMTKFATIVVEPAVSVENCRATIEKLIELSDLPGLSQMRNNASLISYLEGYLNYEKPTLLQFSQQLDLAMLTGIDRMTGRFDAQALNDEETEKSDAPSIGASMRSFLVSPERREQRRAIGALDERLHNKSVTVSIALKQLYRASESHLKAQAHIDGRLILWAWLLLAWETTLSKAALLETYLTTVTRYRAFCNTGHIESEKDLLLDPVLDARETGKGDEVSSLERARGALADAIADRIHDQSIDILPEWTLRLRFALELERTLGARA